MVRRAGMESVFLAIANPTRRALLDALLPGERTVTELVARVDVTQSAVSQQLGILKHAGLVAERSEGRFRYYRLRAAPLADLEKWIARYRDHLNRQLDALGRVLDAMPAETPQRKRKVRPWAKS